MPAPPHVNWYILYCMCLLPFLHYMYLLLSSFHVLHHPPLCDSGKYTLGFKQALKSLRNGKSKLILLANNCPPLRKSEVDYYAMLAKISVKRFSGNNVELGTACGKMFRSSVMSITDPGDSDILRQ